jgi:uncharacterized protein (TIGR00369 family)
MQGKKEKTKTVRASISLDGHRLPVSVQPLYGSKKNHCFGCAPGNRIGLHLHFEQRPGEKSVECHFRMPRRFEGPPGHVHGGILATILDEAMGKVNRQKNIVALTRQMTVEYLRPAPVLTPLVAVGWPVSEHGRKHQNAAEIRTLDGEVLTRSEGLFISIDPVAMFDQQQKKTASQSAQKGSARSTR